MPVLKRLDYTPILGWSSTRHHAFSLCRRRYYYTYYAKYDGDLPSRTIEQYKGLVSIPLEIGGIVHEVVQALLSRLRVSIAPIDEGCLFDFARRATIHHINTKIFDEVAYGAAQEVQVDDLFPKIRSCLENLLASNRLRWLTSDALESSPEWIIDPPGYGETRLGDLKLYCKVDFLFPVHGEYHIVDWKTGQPDPHRHRRQLVGYASWASFHFDTEPDNVRPSLAYLQPAYNEVHETFNQFDLESFAIQVRAETQEMYEYCRDVEQNIPLDKDQFPLVDNERICAFCNFRGLCYPARYPANL